MSIDCSPVLRASLMALAAATVLIVQADRPAQAAWGNSEIRGQVARGKGAVIRRLFLFRTDGCRGVPPMPWTVDPKPKLGTVTEFKGSMKQANGPCPNVEMPYLELRYTAGSQPGTDRFTLYLSDGSYFTPVPVVVEVK